ncbi:hypothetical protein DRE43_19250 [Salmonella enterica subsp. enterica serovar Java]|nr:hypothetical protein [Salmonella enterica]EBL6729384.1 hypothetical protein [Salmonella enterica]EBX2066769.1 hypothetical protein [Salmonella enterica subsp. enterica serovar Java]
MNTMREPFLVSIHVLAALCTILSMMVVYNAFDTHRGGEFALYAILFTGALWLIVSYFLIGGKRKINRIANSIFGNNATVISHYAPGSGRYIGIDTNTGNILLIALNKSGQKVFGFDFNDWAGYEQNDCALTLKFNNLDTPSFKVNSNAKIIPFIHKLDFLLSQSYSPSKGNNKKFSQIVAERMQAA